MSDLYVYMFCSRNKDNKDVSGFKQRTKIILEYKENGDKVIENYKDFVAKGVSGEKTRLYRSVNSRNEEKIREALTIRLIKDKPSMTNINSVLTSVAMQKENRDENKWLFDFDIDDEEKVEDFIDDIYFYSELNIDSHELHKTPHGYAIVVPHGFDTRDLFEKWEAYDITLKKDDLLFINILTNK